MLITFLNGRFLLWLMMLFRKLKEVYAYIYIFENFVQFQFCHIFVFGMASTIKVKRSEGFSANFFHYGFYAITTSESAICKIAARYFSIDNSFHGRLFSRDNRTFDDLYLISYFPNVRDYKDIYVCAVFIDYIHINFS